MVPVAAPPDGVNQGAEAGILSDNDLFLSADSENEDEREKKNQKKDIKDRVDQSERSMKGLLRLAESGMKAAESFSDFVKYEDKENEEFPKVRESPRGSPVRSLGSPIRSLPTSSQGTPKRISGVLHLEASPQTIMQACVVSFHKLFSTVVKTHIVTDIESMLLCLAQFHAIPNPGSTFKTRLETMKYAPDGEWKSRLETYEDDLTPDTQVKMLKLDDVSTKMCEAFACACQLLVDFSCFPMYCTDQHRLLYASMANGMSLFFSFFFFFF